MDLQKLEQQMIDEFFEKLQRQADQSRRAAPSLAPQRAYYVQPQSSLERDQLEEQLRILVNISVVRVYEMLKQKFIDSMNEKDEKIEAALNVAEQNKKRAEAAERKAEILYRF